jgi:predicted phage terminase large subunit-like protein
LVSAVAWPAWLLLRSGGQARVMAGSYSYDLAAKDSMRCRALVTSPWFRALVEATTVPAWGLRDDAARRDDWWTTTSGRRLVTSVGGKSTGERCSFQLVDDALSAADAMSEAARAEAARWVTEVLPSRLEDPERDTRVIIGQRLHSADPIGVVLEQGGWRHLVLPAVLDEGAPRCELRRDDGSLVWKDERQPGEPLLPLLSPSALARLKTELGSAAYSAQYMQSPVDLEGGMLRRSWWRFWKPDGVAPDGPARRPAGCSDAPARPLPEKFQQVVGSLDAAFKGEATSDYVVFQVWGFDGADAYLLDMTRRRMDFPATLAEFRRLAARWPGCRRWLVEDRANGSAVISTLQREIPGVVPVQPDGGKEARVAAVSGVIEAGNVHLPEGAPWLSDFVEECAAFPRGKNDDVPDAMAYALQRGGMSREARRAALLFGIA